MEYAESTEYDVIHQSTLSVPAISDPDDINKIISDYLSLEKFHPFVKSIKTIRRTPKIVGSRYIVTFTTGEQIPEEVVKSEKGMVRIRAATFQKSVPYFYIEISCRPDPVGYILRMRMLKDRGYRLTRPDHTFDKFTQIIKVFFPEVLASIKQYIQTGIAKDKMVATDAMIAKHQQSYFAQWSQ